MHRLGAFLRQAISTPLPDWILLAQAWGWLLIMDIGLRLVPFSRLSAFARRGKPRRAAAPAAEEAPQDSQWQTIRRTRQMVDRARRYHLIPMTCLRRSLAMQKLLARQGIPVDLRIGVRKDGGKLSAHAWLEFLGKPVGEAEMVEENFARLL
jgi:hypothetical protein